MKTTVFTSLCAAALFTFAHVSVANAQSENFEPTPSEFINSCASCHGVDAKGAGFLMRVFRGVDPGDLTQLAARNDGQFPFDQVFRVIDGRAEIAAHGDRKMPVWGDRYWEDAMSDFGPDEINRQRARSRILELVYYLQSIQE
ncbi:MAG: cytochrome c [Boseongicola sp.]|nr:cytochrome c [Boseongicola sp.]NNJ69024.1 cytochrome c [Boseongicola sp.]